MKTKDLLFFNSHTKTKVNLSVYHVVLKKALRIRYDNGKITSLPIETLSKEISNLVSLEISGVPKLEFSKNPLLVEQIFDEFKKVQAFVPERLLQECHEIIIKAKETQSLQNLSLNEDCLTFFVYMPKRGGDQKIRVYHKELQKAVTISNNKDVSSITVSTLFNEIKKEISTIMEKHYTEEYFENKELMIRVLSGLKKQSLETNDLSPMDQKEFEEVILNMSRAGTEIELEEE